MMKTNDIRIIQLADFWGVPVNYAERIYRWHREKIEPFEWIIKELVKRGMVKKEMIQQLWEEYWDNKIKEIDELQKKIKAKSSLGKAPSNIVFTLKKKSRKGKVSSEK